MWFLTSCDRKECAAHALDCMRRLVRALLGPSAVAEKKAEWGESLQILGVEIAPNEEGFTCRLAPKKAEKCRGVIEAALTSGHMAAGCAQKLAGRLSWATQFLFKRLGRAMLRPIFQQGHCR